MTTSELNIDSPLAGWSSSWYEMDESFSRVYRQTYKTTTDEPLYYWLKTYPWFYGWKNRGLLSQNTPDARGWRDSSDFWARIVSMKVKTHGHYYRSHSTSYSRYTLEPYMSWEMIGDQLDFSHPENEAILANLRARAETEARIRLKDQKVNAGESLGESRKAFNHLGDSVLRLLRMYNFARQGKWHKLRDELGLGTKRRHTGTMASNWLEYQYAWRPLVGDIYGTHLELQDRMADKPPVQKATRTCTASRTASVPVLRWGAPNAAGYASTQEMTVELDCRSILYATISDEDIAFLAKLGLENPYLIAWNLMPFSFVLDWLVPVGALLESMSATNGLNFKDGALIMRSRIKGDLVQESTAITNLGTYRNWDRQGTILDLDGAYTRRWAYHSFPIAMAYRKPVFNATRAVSALALMRKLT